MIAWQKKRVEIKAREEHAEEVNQGLKVAAKERALLAPVAKRKARTELAKEFSLMASSGNRIGRNKATGEGEGGVVVLEAAYGVMEVYRKAVVEEMANGGGGDPAQLQAPAPSGQTGQAVDQGASAGGEGAEAKDDGDATSSSTAQPLPPPWLRVTEAVQYLVGTTNQTVGDEEVNGSRIVLHAGVSKSGLMAFTDPAPSPSSSSSIFGESESSSSSSSANKGNKQLYVAYLHGGVVREVTVDDLSALNLPPLPRGTGASSKSQPSPGSSDHLTAGLVGKEEGGVGHEVVKDEAKRRWLVSKGVQCLGLDQDKINQIIKARGSGTQQYPKELALR